MAEKPIKLFKPVKLLGIQDYMYPPFNFLKQRLLSIYPRFKAVIEREKLDELIPDGKQLMHDIDDAVEPLKDTVTLYLMGTHAAIEDKLMKESLIASSRCGFKKNNRVTKQSVNEEDCIQNLATKPSVIIYVVPSAGRRGRRLKPFDDVSEELLVLLPITGRRSYILCTESCTEFVTLYEFNEKGNISLEHVSLGWLIQSSLEEKVVAVLQLMREFIDKNIFHHDIHRDSLEGKRMETLKRAVLESLKIAGSEIRGSKGAKSTMLRYLCMETEAQICQNLSSRCNVKENIIKKDLQKARLDEAIKENFEKIPDIHVFQQSATDTEGVCKAYVAKIKDHLDDFEDKIIEKFRIISMIDFELNGVFRQANLQTGPSPDISKTLQTRILGINGVYGCGVMLGNLVVHVEEYAKVDLEEITNKVIETVMDSESKQFVNHLEVKRVRLNPNAGITHESGQCVRVRKSSVGGGATADDGYWQGTLGCFAKGCVNGANEKMFVLSCAHVFPDGCSHIVEIPRANSQTEFDVIGEFNPEYRLLWENKLDIVAISVNPSARNKCHLWLKNSGGCDDWKVVPHEGDLKQLLGYQVYKWGSVTNLTQGMVVCVNYKSYGQTGFGDQYNIFIRSPPDSSSLFSLQGDSGSVVCFDDSFQETVRVLSLINGDMTDIASGKVICSYSCHLKKNLDALAERTNRNFELYNH